MNWRTRVGNLGEVITEEVDLYEEPEVEQ